MPKCDNCASDAVYAIADPGALPQDFCDTHLPRFLRSRAVAGHLKLHSAPVVPEIRQIDVEAPVAPEAVVEEAPLVVEEVVVEELPTIEDETVTKTTRKKAAPSA